MDARSVICYFLPCWTQEEEAGLKKAFGDGPIPGLWQGDQQRQHAYPSNRWGDRGDAAKQRFPDSFGAGGMQVAAGKDERRAEYDWLQPSGPKEQPKKVRIALDEPLFPEDLRKTGRQAAEGPKASTTLAGFEELQRQLREERRPEYNQTPERKRQEESPQRELKAASTDSGLFSRLGSRESERDRLREERHREYNEMLERKHFAEVQRERKTPSASRSVLSSLDSRDGDRGTRLREERHREYNEMLERKKLAEMPRERKTPSVDNGLFSRLGSRENYRERLWEERHQEYQEFLKVDDRNRLK